MNEIQERPAISWIEEIHPLETPAVVIIGSTDLHDDSSQPQDDVDTSLVPAADDRIVEVPNEEQAVAGNIKKPPIEPPGTTQESADGYPEEEPKHAASALGELASGTEVKQPLREQCDPYSGLPLGLEVIREDDVTIVVNRNHSDQALVDKALAAYRDNPDWPDAPLEQYPERTYHVDDENNPALFAKATNYSFYPGVVASEGLNEVVLTEEIKEVVNSDEAQRVVRDGGFERVTFVEPLLTASPDGTNMRTTIYPWQEGRSITTVAIEQEGGNWEQGVRKAADVVDDLRVLFSEQGINARDLNHDQIRVGYDNNVQLMDAELYRKFDKPTATFVPDQVAHLQDGEWRESDNTLRQDLVQPKEVTVASGSVALARGSDSAQSPELSTEKNTGRVIVFWNIITKEAAMVNNTDARELGAELRQVYEKLPNLKGLGTIEHAVGNYDIVRHPTLVHGVTPTARKSVPVTGVVDVRLDTATGTIEVYSKDGTRLYRYKPPTGSGA